MQQINNSHKERIEWVDFFKGILICLVVIGHATGRFNGWIYQFHVGAFFMISGFTTKRKAGNSIKRIVLRFYSLLLPLIVSFLILLPIVKLLNEYNLYGTFFNYDFIGVKKVLSQFFIYGNNYINWLGAGWFLPVLFGLSVLDEVLIQFNMNKTQYFFISLLIYLFGFVLVHTGFHGNNCITVVFPKVFTCYGFFAIGNLFKSISDSEFSKSKKTLFVIVILNCCLMYFFKKIRPTVIQYVGKNTLGILLFHFMFFKVAYVILYVFVKIPKYDISLLVPNHDVGCKWWWFISIVSIILSLSLWEIIKRIPIINFLFGCKKEIINKYSSLVPCFKN